MSKASDFTEIAALADRVRLATKRALCEQTSKSGVVITLKRADAQALLELSKDLLAYEVKPCQQ